MDGRNNYLHALLKQSVLSGGHPTIGIFLILLLLLFIFSGGGAGCVSLITK
jgi:hypothetical protein